jgi:thioredoxin reductase (NADPH)
VGVDGQYRVVRLVGRYEVRSHATEEALFITRFARHVSIVTRDRQLTAPRVARDQVLRRSNIDVRYRTTVHEFRGKGELQSVVLRHLDHGSNFELHVAALVFIGLQPNTDFLRGFVELEGDGSITTSLTLVSSVPGVFAGGDARAGSTKQLVSAAGEGAAAALMIREYLRTIKETRSAAGGALRNRSQSAA